MLSRTVYYLVIQPHGNCLALDGPPTDAHSTAAETRQAQVGLHDLPKAALPPRLPPSRPSPSILPLCPSISPSPLVRPHGVRQTPITTKILPLTCSCSRRATQPNLSVTNFPVPFVYLPAIIISIRPSCPTPLPPQQQQEAACDRSETTTTTPTPLQHLHHCQLPPTRTPGPRLARMHTHCCE